MMYVNVVCTCASQVILSFIFSLMSEPLEILEVVDKTGYTLTWEIRRDNLPIFRQEGPVPTGTTEYREYSNDLKEPLNEGTTINPNNLYDKRNTYDLETYSSSHSSSTGYIERNLQNARVKSDEVRRLMMMFFSFCDPLNSKV